MHCVEVPAHLQREPLPSLVLAGTYLYIKVVDPGDAETEVRGAGVRLVRRTVSLGTSCSLRSALETRPAASAPRQRFYQPFQHPAQPPPSPQPPQGSFFSRAGAFIPGTRYFSGWYNVVSSLSSSFTALPALANEIPPAVATPGPPLATAWLPEGFVSSPSPPASPRSPSGPRPSPAPPACTDVPPSADYTCAQQAGWGKCKYAAWCLGGMCTHALGPGHCLACAGGLEQQMSTWIGR